MREPLTPTLKLCSDLTTFVTTNWKPSSPDAVNWGYFTRFGDADDPNTNVIGRQVEFFSAEDYEWETATREHDNFTHHVSCLVVERYTDAGDPPRDWWQDRVDFVYTQIVAGLRFTRNGPAPFNPMLMTLKGKVQVCDLEKLLVSKLFYALV